MSRAVHPTTFVVTAAKRSNDLRSTVSNDNPLTYWQQVQSALTHPDA